MNDLEQMTSDVISAAVVASVLGVHPQSIRVQAQKDPSKLGFPCIVVGTKLLIPRQPFINYVKGATNQ